MKIPEHLLIKDVDLPVSSDINEKIVELRPVRKMENGHIVNDLCFVEVPLSEVNKGLKVSDFHLEVLEEAGFKFNPLNNLGSFTLNDIDIIVKNVKNNE